MEAVQQSIETKLLKELFHADDLVILADTIREAEVRLNIWTTALRKFALKVNLDKKSDDFQL